MFVHHSLALPPPPFVPCFTPTRNRGSPLLITDARRSLHTPEKPFHGIFTDSENTCLGSCLAASSCPASQERERLRPKRVNLADECAKDPNYCDGKGAPQATLTTRAPKRALQGTHMRTRTRTHARTSTQKRTHARAHAH